MDKRDMQQFRFLSKILGLVYMWPAKNQAGMKTEIVWMFTWDQDETPCQHFALIHYEHV